MAVTSFPHAAQIPIVGQRVAVLGYTLVVHVQCNCEQRGFVPLVLSQGLHSLEAAINRCPQCGQMMHVASMALDANGQPQFAISLDSAGAGPGTPS